MIPALMLSLIMTVTPAHSEYRAAHSVEATVKEGFQASLYRGEWYSPKWWKARKCIMYRESRYDYSARNKSSSAQGAYQFLDSKWRDSLVWMMLKESNTNDDGLQPVVRNLRDKPIAKWSRYWQDRAFYTAWQHSEGKLHWYYNGSKCF
jgi:hypothetical protein